MRTLLLAIALILTSLLLLKIVVVFVEPKLTFFPRTPRHNPPPHYSNNLQEFSIPTPDGETLNAWLIESREPEAYLLFFHGNAGNISSAGRLELYRQFLERGFSVFVFDYRGYGASSGSPTEEGLLQDVRGAVPFFWEEIAEKHSLPVLYFGRSLGGWTAAYGTSLIEPDALILEATFPDKWTLLEHYPWPLRILGVFSRYELATVSFLTDYKKPALVIHGTRDRIVPFEVGRKLFQRLSTPQKDLLVLEGASHMDQAEVGGSLYWNRIRNLVGEVSREQGKLDSDQ